MSPHISPYITAATLATARAVVLNPGSFHDDPDSRLSAWIALKRGRGQRLDARHIQRLERYQRHYAAPLSLIRSSAPAPCPEAPFYDGMAAR